MESRKNRCPRCRFYPSPRISALLFSLLAVFLLRAEDTAEKTALPPSPASAPAEVLLGTVSAHLDAIKKESPVFYRQLERKMAKEKDRLAGQFLLDLSSAITEHPVPMQKNAKIQPFHSALLANNRILYLSPGTFTPEIKVKLEDALHHPIQNKTPLIGIVLDLRDASGENPLDGWHFFSLFSFNTEKHAVPREPLPILVLTNGNTSGAAEILAKLLEHTRYGLCIGEKTRGMPFQSKTILSGEYMFSIPLIPEELENLTPDALIPAITTAALPRMTFAELSQNKPLSELSDPTLNRAKDLLLSLDTLNQKWRK